MTVELGLGMIAMFLAATTAGALGFGTSLIAAPFLLLFLPPQIVTPLLLIFGTIVNAGVAIEARKDVQIGKIWPLMIAAAVFTPIGTLLLEFASVEALKLLAGFAISVGALALLFEVSQPIRRERFAFVCVGAMSGILGGSTSLNGPPVMLFYANQELPKAVFRANLVVFFLFLDAISVLVFWEEGIITQDVIFYSGWFLLPALVGLALGIVLSKKVQEQLFRKLALYIVLITAVVVLAEGLGLV